ncbi:berberine bridge enzyme-like 22 [Olea europaea var. sylvestris]|uniref:Tetrahydrocannabinolic acid synthase-like n=1 Tax=Olea europaea subsp. europaea TaxID=158383 RepID=A0A8S0VNP9_OLEEU|nr:berberine bridge enzyme-like 22 [Olea europaea var. sylvestris]CAA3033797.1 tetrahydrocannabinolic acid synthase-like [Olea europaea subsp. europaea]
MAPLGSIIFALFSLPFLVASHNQTLSEENNQFHECLLHEANISPKQLDSVLYNKSSPSYLPIFESKLRNQRFNSSNVSKPRYIITPYNPNHIIGAVKCSKRFNLDLRVRSGGHDYEGLSYWDGRGTFVLLDLEQYRKIDVNVTDETAWVQAGAALGEVYYNIANKSGTLAFPSGLCRGVGVGGHISGGGQGTLMRKYGLAADNVIDAYIVNANGTLLDRKGMGEDVFWAIRGGGAGSFGVLVAWKLKLVHVPPKVTVFTVQRSLEQGATKLIQKWQKLENQLPRDLFLRILILMGQNEKGMPTIEANFESAYQGPIDQLIPIMKKHFPQLKLKPEDCRELTWIESALYFDDGYKRNESVPDLLNRHLNLRPKFFKAKSDFVTKPISKKGLKKIWEAFMQEGGGQRLMILVPYGGILSEIPENKTPFPYRAGTLFNILYYTNWNITGDQAMKNSLEWINRLYNVAGNYLPKPRAGYLNYRDLDLGMDMSGNATYSQAADTWGRKYFKDNFKKLAEVKFQFDPENFFRNEQSIPPLYPQ